MSLFFENVPWELLGSSDLEKSGFSNKAPNKVNPVASNLFWEKMRTLELQLVKRSHIS